MSVLPFLGTVVLALVLTGCYTKLGTVASSESSSGETSASATTVAAPSPSSDATARTSSNADTLDAVDTFLQDFDYHSLKYLDPSDRALVKRATRLLVTRANSEISRATYRERVVHFRLNHSSFYGNFFGDPYYATYDLRYIRLAKLGAGFYCNPLSYDPNFGGVCRGIQYAASDFFILPSGSFSPAFPHTIPPRSDLSLAGANRPGTPDWNAPLWRSEVDNQHHRPVGHRSSPGDSTMGISPGVPPSTPIADPAPPEGNRVAKLKVPSEVETLSNRDVASLTRSLRERLSPQERSALVRHLSTLRVGHSGMSSPRHRTLSLHVETIRRAAQRRLYGSRSNSRGLTAGQSDAPLSDVSSSNLLYRLDRRRGRRAGSSTHSTADRSTRSSNRARRMVGRSTGARDGSSTGSSSSGRSDTADQSDSDRDSSSSSGRTGRDSDDSSR